MMRIRVSVNPEEAFHLPDKHNQKSHGNRAGKKDNVAGKTSKHRRPDDDAPSKSTTPKSKPAATSGPMTPDQFNKKVSGALTGKAALSDGLTYSNVQELGAAYEKNRSESDPPTNRMLGGFSMYEGGMSEEINRDLRSGDTSDDMTNRITNYMDAGFKQSKTESDIVVYRGIMDANSTFGSDWSSDGDNTGLEWQDNAYMSTSSNRTVAESFAKDLTSTGVVMRVLVPKGTPAIATDNPSSQSIANRQDGILVDKKRRMRVVRDYMDRESFGREMRMIDVEVIS